MSVIEVNHGTKNNASEFQTLKGISLAIDKGVVSL